MILGATVLFFVERLCEQQAHPGELPSGTKPRPALHSQFRVRLTPQEAENSSRRSREIQPGLSSGRLAGDGRQAR